MEEKYISKITLELRPKSRHCYLRLFGKRENTHFNAQTFDRQAFRRTFDAEFNNRVVHQGEYIRCAHLILAVEQVQHERSTTAAADTRVEFTIKGEPLPVQQEMSVGEGTSNECFSDDDLCFELNTRELDSCYCCECHRSLSVGDLFILSVNWSQPILCSSCYQTCFTYRCVHCRQAIKYQQASSTSDAFLSIRFVEHNGLYWHADCCVCVTCSRSLIGEHFYQEPSNEQLFCVQHMPCR